MNLKANKRAVVPILVLLLFAIALAIIFFNSSIKHPLNIFDERLQFGFGGQGGEASHSKLTMQNLQEIGIGAYHSAKSDGSSIVTFIRQDSFDLADYHAGDNTNSDDHAKVIGESITESRSEIPIAIVNFGQLTSAGNVNFKWYHPDGRKIFELNHNVPNPNQMDWCVWEKCWWNWYSIYSWVGFFSNEINEKGLYKVVITSSWGEQEMLFFIDNTANKCFEDAQCGKSQSCIDNVCINKCGNKIADAGETCKSCTLDIFCGNNQACDNQGSCMDLGTINNCAFLGNLCTQSQKCENNVCIEQPKVAFCMQVVTTACNSNTKEIREFGNGCIPDGWTTDLSLCIKDSQLSLKAKPKEPQIQTKEQNLFQKIINWLRNLLGL